MQALLLNASYEPLHLVEAKRAVCLILEGKADLVLPVEGRSFHSESQEIPLPSILRLNRFVKLPFDRTVSLNRVNILIRDHRICAYCPRPANTMDHVVPRSKGGPHSWANVVACCRRCNLKKGDRSLSDLGWSLKFTPMEPRGTGRLMKAAGMARPEWLEYLGHMLTPERAAA